MTPGQPGPQTVPAALAAQLASGPWDQPPAVYLIGGHDGRCEFRLLPVPALAWDLLPLHRVIGAAVRFEAWDLPWPLLHGPALDQARADLAAGRVHARPDRIERRFLLAAARDGTAWEATQVRTPRQAPPRTTAYLPRTRPPDPTGAYDALRHITRALLSPEPPSPEP